MQDPNRRYSGEKRGKRHKLEGTVCGNKATSCPDQLSKALRLALEASAQ